jgi:hypothetical protein
MIAHGFTGSPARAGVVRVGVVEPWVAWERESSPPGTAQGFSPGRRCVVPGALGLLTQVFPPLKRWAFLSRPAWRDSRVSDSSLNATSNGVREGDLVAALGLKPFHPQCGTRHAGRNWHNPSASGASAHTFVAFDLMAVSYALAASSSQSVIGEINLLTLMIPGRGRAVAAGVSPLCRRVAVIASNDSWIAQLDITFLA